MENPPFWWVFSRKDRDFHGRKLLVSGRVNHPHHQINNTCRSGQFFLLSGERATNSKKWQLRDSFRASLKCQDPFRSLYCFMVGLMLRSIWNLEATCWQSNMSIVLNHPIGIYPPTHSPPRMPVANAGLDFIEIPYQKCIKMYNNPSGSLLLGSCNPTTNLTSPTNMRPWLEGFPNFNPNASMISLDHWTIGQKILRFQKSQIFRVSPYPTCWDWNIYLDHQYLHEM